MSMPSSDMGCCQSYAAACAIGISVLIALGLDAISVVLRGCGRLEMRKASY